MAEIRYELKLADGRRAEWVGASGEDAARRYTDAMRVAGRDVIVVATRRKPEAGISVLGSGRIIG